MEWVFCESRLPDQRQLCVVACYEWDMYEDNWSSGIRYRLLEYLPGIGIWNVKEPVRVLAWIPIPEFHHKIEIPVIVPKSPPQLVGRLCMPEPEEEKEQEKSVKITLEHQKDFFDALNMAIRQEKRMHGGSL